MEQIFHAVSANLEAANSRNIEAAWRCQFVITRRELLVASTVLGATAALARAEPDEPDSFSTVSSRRSGLFGGKRVEYVATVGETLIYDDERQPTVRFVSTSYVATGVDSARRPVLFAFNGGPSVASAMLHMLALGPKRVVLAQDPSAPETPTTFRDNPLSVLDVADLVFIDPSETGFSRILPAGRRAELYSVNGDARSVADFVLAWSKANGREASPKFVLGESYGTIRAAVMAGQLADEMPLEGVYLFGQAINMIETSQRARNAIAYATNLTALAAIAAYHGRARGHARSPEAIVDEAYRFGMTDYLRALVAGYDLPERHRRRIALKLEHLTGISAGYYLANDLAITKIEFAKELLKDRGLQLAIYDARFTFPIPQAGERPQDPVAAIATAAYELLKQYFANDLGVASARSEYRPAAPETQHWEWNGTLGPGGPFLDYDYPAQLSRAFRANPRFRLAIGTGYHDLTTTIGPARYLVTRSDYPRDRVVQHQYFGGHMAYIHDPSHVQFTSDVRRWLQGQAS